MTNPTSSFSKGISTIYRVVKPSGKEIIHVPRAPELEWNAKVLEKLRPHFTEDTKFFIRHETKGRTYGVPRAEWQELTADDLIYYGIYGHRREVQ